MTLDALIDSLPSFAKDLRLNFSSLVRNNSELSTQQLWGTAVVSAIATRNTALTSAVLADAQQKLSAQALEAAKAVAAVMGMNNVWYRFHHLSSNPKYAEMPARLRMTALRGHNVEEADTELWALAVSTINGCAKCVDAHERTVRGKGASEELVASVVRVASVIHAIGAVLDALAPEELEASVAAPAMSAM